MKYIYMVALMMALIGCGEDDSANTLMKEVKADLWEYLIPSTDVTNVYDLVVYDENDTITDSLYGYRDYTYEHISSDKVYETTSASNTPVLYTKLDDVILIDTNTKKRFVKIGDTVEDCIVKSIDDNLTMVCDYGTSYEYRYYKKHSGLLKKTLYHNGRRYEVEMN